MNIGLDIDVLFGGIAILVDAEARILATGAGLPELLGSPASAVIGTSLAELVIDEDGEPSIREWLEGVARQDASGEAMTARFVGAPDDLWSLSCHRQVDGNFLVAARRSQHELWRLLIDARRQVALGRLARPIAHEFNNVLHLVSSSIACIQSVVEHGDPVDDTRPWLSTARNAIDRGKLRIRELQPLLRGECRRVAAGTLLEHLVGLLEYRLQGRIELSCESPWTAIECDPALVVELLVTLLEHNDTLTSSMVRVRLRGRPEPGNRDGWELTVEQHQAIVAPRQQAHHATLDTLLTRLAAVAGARLVIVSPVEARLVWQTVGEQDMLADELMVLTVGPPVLRRPFEAACRPIGWDVLGADTPASAIDLIDDYRDELDGIIACVPDSAVDLSSLRRAAGDIPLVGGDCTLGPELLQRRLFAARWNQRLRRWTAP